MGGLFAPTVLRGPFEERAQNLNDLLPVARIYSPQLKAGSARSKAATPEQPMSTDSVCGIIAIVGAIAFMTFYDSSLTMSLLSVLIFLCGIALILTHRDPWVRALDAGRHAS